MTARRHRPGDRIIAGHQGDREQSVRRGHLVARGFDLGLARPASAVRMLGGPRFWALLAGAGPGYTFTRAYGSIGGGWVTPPWAATGDCEEVNDIAGLAGMVVEVTREGGRNVFAWSRRGSSGCGNTVCVRAYKLKEFCAEYPTIPDCSSHIPDPLSGVPVTITRSYTDGTGYHVEAFDSGVTDSNGSFCSTIPIPTLANPTSAPTVDPVGGGTSGGAMLPRTYRAVYTWVTHYGETGASPSSTDFQVGIPDPVFYPTLAAPTIVTPGLSPGGLLQVGTYQARALYRDAGGHHNLPTALSANIVVGTLGDIPRISVPALSLRPNASTVDIYLDDGGGDAYLYLSGLTSTSDIHLDIALDTGAPLVPASNNSLANIPRVTFATGGIKTRIYARVATGSGTTAAAGYRWEATTSPKDLVGPLSGFAFAPPASNTTADGDYHVSAHPTNCNKRTGDFAMSGGVATPCLFDFGFCCFAHEITITDVDTADVLHPAVNCGNPSACTDEDGDKIPSAGFKADFTNAPVSEFVGPCAGTPCPAPATKPAEFCDQIPDTGTLLDGSRVTGCALTLAGYYDDVICVPAPCAVPGIRTTKSGVMYSKANWVEFFGCCPPTTSCRANTPRPEMIPKTLYAAISGPAWLVGGGGSYTLDYSGHFVVGGVAYEEWTTGLIAGQGGYGTCYKATPPLGSGADGENCWYYRDTPYCDDTTKYRGTISNSQQLLYSQTKVTLRVQSPRDGNPCLAFIYYENSGLPGGCPTGWTAAPTWRTCELATPCGGGMCDYYRVAGYQGTELCIIPLALGAGGALDCTFSNPVAYSGSGMSDNTISGCGTLANASISS